MRCEINRSQVSDEEVIKTLRRSERDWPVSKTWDTKKWFVSYRRFLSLRGGKRVMLRFLNERDRKNLIQLFGEASEEDIQFIKHDVKDLKLLHYCLEHLNYGRALPLVAVNLKDNRFIGGGILLKGKHANKHIGEIRIFVSRLFRNLGLGSVILDELINLAVRENLHYLMAEVVIEQTQALKALNAKGFEIKALLDDFFLGKNGETHDVILMMRPLVRKGDVAHVF